MSPESKLGNILSRPLTNWRKLPLDRGTFYSSVFLFAAIQGVDITTTIMSLNSSGNFREIHPVLASVIRELGYPGLIAFKIAGVGLCSSFSGYFARRYGYESVNTVLRVANTLQITGPTINSMLLLRYSLLGY